MGKDFLAGMAAASRGRAQAARRAQGIEALKERALALPAPPGLRISGTGFDIIAEFKLRAPSKGQLTEARVEPGRAAAAYAAAGAAAVSVLTEPDRFAGSLAHLEAASEALAGTGVPAMRKDFVVDPYQVWEARAAGAGGVLLIVAMLDDPTLNAALDAAAEAGLFVLLEAFDRHDLTRSQRVASRPNLLVGLNCRNLRSLDVETARFAELADAFPAGPPRVAESGLASPDDVALVAELGYDLALIGSALMGSDDPAGQLSTMLEAGRGVRA